MSSGSVAPIVNFDELRQTLEQEQQLRDEIRDAVKQLEQDERQCLTALQRSHQTPQSKTQDILTLVDSLVPAVQSSLAKLSQIIPPHEFYRYNSMFSHSLQNASYIIVYYTFLLTSIDNDKGPDVPTRDEVSARLAIKPEWRDSFFLPTEDYLHSLISLLNELSRLAINKVTLGDFDAPPKYSRFAKELSTAFSILNLKNDSLRKRFDSIKYDVKKLEESKFDLVYDLSLRGLLNTPTMAAATTIVTDQDQSSTSKKLKMDESA
ncbi:Translin-1 [Microbotryomycetes sp. JL201]|nr:Translin-1 [Microbotryomycetes sp. JL201]